MARASGARRGYNARWRKARLLFLETHPLCAECAKGGKAVVATDVDHIEPHRGDFKRFWDTDNWQGLCKPHHDVKTATETGWGNKRHGEHRPPWMPRPVCAVTIVCGPPGSGKTTYAHQHKGEKDLVIDLDEIQAELTGLPMYCSPPETLGPAIGERNARLAALSRTMAPKAWVILTAPSEHLREWWAGKLDAEIVVLDVPADECKRRIRADERRPKGIAQQHCEAVDRWWLTERGHREVSMRKGVSEDGTPTDPLHRWNRAMG